MEKKVLKTSEDWKALKQEIKGKDTFLYFESESRPKKYPCIMMYSFAEDLDFGNTYSIGFVYLSDFKTQATMITKITDSKGGNKRQKLKVCSPTSPVKAKFVSQLKIGDWVNTNPKGKARNEQITKIEPNQDDERIVDIHTQSGIYQATLGSIVLP